MFAFRSCLFVSAGPTHLFLKPCKRCRKEQMELCLALNRRNSAYLCENSRSNPTQPPQVLSIFRCILKPFCSSSDALDMLQDVCTSCVDPPESGLQGLACRVQPWGVHMSEAMQEALHLIFIAEDIPKKPNTFTYKNWTLM